MPKIFLSSTQKDLKEERLFLIDKLKKSGYDVVAMEWLPAFSSYPKVEVEKLVKQCEIYILLIGESYGSIPEVDSVPFEKSFTEFEYEEAFKKEEKLILCFFKEIERTEERLVKFTERVGKNHGINTFKNADQLPGIVLAALINASKNPDNKNLFQSGTNSKFSSDLKYFCNRSNQADALDYSFYTLNPKNPIHLFLLPGQKEDSHSSFVNRYSCQFRYTGKKVVEVTVFTKYMQDDVKLVYRIKNEIRTQLEEQLTLPLQQITTADIFDALNKAKKDFLIINLIVESTTLRKNNIDYYKKAILNFYSNIAAFDNPLEEKKILIFLLFRQSGMEEDIQLSSQIIDDDSFLKDNKLPRLEKIHLEDIEEWLFTRNIERNEEYIQATLKKYFPVYYESRNPFSMSKAEIVLDQILTEKSKNS